MPQPPTKPAAATAHQAIAESEQLLAPGDERAQGAVEADAEQSQGDVHDQGGKDAAGHGGGIMQAAEGVRIHAGSIAHRFAKIELSP